MARIVKSATDARAAERGTGLSTVLAVSTIAVIVIFAALWIYYFL